MLIRSLIWEIQCTSYVNFDHMRDSMNERKTVLSARKGNSDKILASLTTAKLLNFPKISLARPPHKLRSDTPRIKVGIITSNIPALCHRSSVCNQQRRRRLTAFRPHIISLINHVRTFEGSRNGADVIVPSFCNGGSYSRISIAL
jgi:hypothetical protein